MKKNLKKMNASALLACVALLVLLPCAVLFLVPASSAKVVDFFQPLTEVEDPYTDFCLTRYGLGAALSTLAGLLMMLCCPSSLTVRQRVLTGLTGGVGALLGARLLYVATRFSYIMTDLGGGNFLWQFWQGGYTLYGGLLGGMAAIALYAHFSHQKVLSLLDAATPGALLALCGLRLSEAFSGQGTSKLMEDIGLFFLPFQQMGEYDDAVLCVWAYEALMALIALITVLVMNRRAQPQGRVLETGLILVSIAQVLLDSWRADELIRFGFVRLNMLMAAAVLAVILVTRLIRILRSGGSRGRCIARGAVFLLGAGVCIAIEFALDKSPIDNGLLYLVMIAALVLMLCAMLFGDGRQSAVQERN